MLLLSGIRSCTSAFIVPVATGMAIMLCLLYFAKKRPDAKIVLWSRIDQKSCFKSILTAGLEPVIVEPVKVGDELQTNMDELKTLVESFGAEKICCVLTTTSCFAPRAPDDIEEVSKLCKEKDIPHIVNNAYGLQSSKCCHIIEQGAKVGRIDAFVQSTDKNFLVPVGGAVVAGFDPDTISDIAKAYPGRASGAPSLDVMITLLSLGVDGCKRLLQQRKEILLVDPEVLDNIRQAIVFGSSANEAILVTADDQVYGIGSNGSGCVALSLSTIDTKARNADDITQLGSMLFKRQCSGVRVVPKCVTKEVESYTFTGFGAHCKEYGCSYLNAAAALGMERSEVDLFVKRLDGAMKDLRKRLEKTGGPQNDNASDLSNNA